MGRKPSKTARMGGKQKEYLKEKDDGTRWSVKRYTENGLEDVYLPRGGLIKHDAQRIADGMAEAAFIDEIKSDD